MTANEMADELELRLDRADSFGSPGYEDFDLSSVLTEAQLLYIKQFVSELNNRKGQGFEETEVRNQGLSALIKQGANLTVSADQTGVLANGKFFDLPTDFMYTIYEECMIDKQQCGTEDFIKAWINVIAHDEIWQYLYNKYKKPYYKDYGWARVWRLGYQRQTSGSDPASPATPKRHQLITDGTFNVTSYTMNYLIFPSDITVDRDTPTNSRNCILDESTHTVIIDMAKDLMLDRVKEQKVQNIVPVKDLE
jgi:hypothetical protein